MHTNKLIKKIMKTTYSAIENDFEVNTKILRKWNA